VRTRLGTRASPLVVALLGAATLLGPQALVGCGETVEVGLDDALTSGGSAGSGGTFALGGLGAEGGVPGESGGAAPCQKVECRGKTYECGNCQDDDEDGLIDALDPDCLGPCDDDEAGLSTGLSPSQSAACRQDCYFDGDSGVGNDMCDWNHRCDPLSVAPDYPPSGEARCEYDPQASSMNLDCEGMLAQQPQPCLDNCLPLVPNGCDCFGCCELPDGKAHFIGHGRGDMGCQLDALDDETTCPLCTIVESCFNPCQAACTSDAVCELRDYCVTGCCVRAPEPI
jgi:hypothetical protein